MFTYKNVEIKLNEEKAFNEGDYTVTKDDGLVFKAESRYGKSYAGDPEIALNGAKSQIDKALGR